MKKIFTLTLAIVMAFSLVACGSGKAPDLTGDWVTAADDNMSQYAEIRDNTITIYWYVAEDDTKMLYWTGTYIPPTKSGDYTWTSTNDRTKTDMALLASGDSEKIFSYKDGVLSYSASMLGVSKTVKLSKIQG